ncbi:MAG: NYN domain-containing protein [Chloroflexus sp.]
MPSSPFNLLLSNITGVFRQLAHTAQHVVQPNDIIKTTATLLAPERRVALLIDGENCPATYAEQVMRHLAHEHGAIMARRVYANWSLPNNYSWIEPVVRYNLRPIHHGRVATNKNAIDILLTVEAMELLYQEQITCFYLAASDSDDTPLVNRLRAAGAEVIVIGNGQTSDSLKEACNRFIPLTKPEPAKSGESVGESSVQAARLTPPHNMLAITQPTPAPPRPSLLTTPTSLGAFASLASDTSPSIQSAPSPEEASPAPVTIRPLHDAALLIVQILQYISRRYIEGWVGVGALGQQLRRFDPTFTANQFGYNKLSQLIAACAIEYPCFFETRESAHNQLDVRLEVWVSVFG